MFKIPTIIYTITDEAPALATYSLLPIISRFIESVGIKLVVKDISLASRIIAPFSSFLKPKQRIEDHLSDLKKLVLIKKVNIIKLPNISASLLQLKNAIIELQNHGYELPNYVENPNFEREKKINNIYNKIIGSVVNPILREGNSDRRIPNSVKKSMRKYPTALKKWSKDSLSHVSSMYCGDFYGSEKSLILKEECVLQIRFINRLGKKKYLSKPIQINSKEIIDTAVMSKSLLTNFFSNQIKDSIKKNVLLSIHLKCTMMKISDPIIFGVMVSEFYKEVFSMYWKKIKELNFNPNNGIEDLYSKIEILPKKESQEIKKAIENFYLKSPKLAIINLKNGITNLHTPNGVIIDSSMSTMIRDSGKMLGKDGKLHDVKAIIPDRSYSIVYKEIIKNFKKYGSFDTVTMGSFANVGLMAQKAEEYGSHDTTFQAKEFGAIQVVNEHGEIISEHLVNEGDIWRMCRTKLSSVKNWIELAINRIKEDYYDTSIFWLDPYRSHDARMIEIVRKYLKEYDLSGLKIQISSPVNATRQSMNDLRNGKNVISITGNVLRDYLTDFFPIIELGTSSRMISIVSLMKGGSLFETGSGGTAPKHFIQFLEENHLRWDSLGEFLALSESLKNISKCYSNSQFYILSKSLDKAIIQYIDQEKFPSRYLDGIDTRDSHFYLALFWSKYLSMQNIDLSLKRDFKVLYDALAENEKKIILELKHNKGKKNNINGYYHFDTSLVRKIMCPSTTFNFILNKNNLL